MFRLQLHALWSLDYLVPLARLLARVCACPLAEAEAMVRQVELQKTLVLEAPTPAEANFLARDLLQFGVFVEVEQFRPVSEEAMRYDALKSLPPSLIDWYVLVDPLSGRPLQLVERDTLASIRYESAAVTEAVGEAMLSRGALPIDAERMAELDTLIEFTRPQFVLWEQEFMAERIRRIKLDRAQGRSFWMPGGDGPSDGHDAEEE